MIRNRKIYSKKQMQINLYNNIFNNYSIANLTNVIKKVCLNFDKLRCQIIFRDLFINIFYTLFLQLQSFNKIIVINFILQIKNVTINKISLPIDMVNDLKNIENFCLLFQDHTFGHFDYANLAWLTYSLINNII